MKNASATAPRRASTTSSSPQKSLVDKKSSTLRRSFDASNILNPAEPSTVIKGPNQQLEARTSSSNSILSLESYRSNPANSNVNVLCRLRPLCDQSGGPKLISPFHIEGNTIEFQTPENATRVFQFDSIFDESSTQEDLFTRDIQGILDSLLAGYNGTVSVCNFSFY
jgi:hypothetical protein